MSIGQALAIHIVIVVLTIVRNIERSVVVFDSQLLAGILVLVVYIYCISFTAGIRDAARIRTIRCKVAEFTDDTLTADIDMISVASALVGNEVR